MHINNIQCAVFFFKIKHVSAVVSILFVLHVSYHYLAQLHFILFDCISIYSYIDVPRNHRIGAFSEPENSVPIWRLCSPHSSGAEATQALQCCGIAGEVAFHLREYCRSCVGEVESIASPL